MEAVDPPRAGGSPARPELGAVQTLGVLDPVAVSHSLQPSHERPAPPSGRSAHRRRQRGVMAAEWAPQARRVARGAPGRDSRAPAAATAALARNVAAKPRTPPAGPDDTAPPADPTPKAGEDVPLPRARACGPTPSPPPPSRAG